MFKIEPWKVCKPLVIGLPQLIRNPTFHRTADPDLTVHFIVDPLFVTYLLLVV